MGSFCCRTVPGGEGPGGVLVFSQDRVSYVHRDGVVASCPLPHRVGGKEYSLAVTAVTARLRDHQFFILMLDENGDLFKITLGCERKRKAGEDVFFLSLFFSFSSFFSSFFLYNITHKYTYIKNV